MKVLIFDTETTGLPTERAASIMEPNKWPFIVQLSYILYDTDLKMMIDKKDVLIKIPSTVEITPESEAIHHISRTMCEADGIPIVDALNMFNKTLDKCDIVVGHNLSFDKRMIMVECNRLKVYQRFTIRGISKPEYCTMKETVNFCKIEKINQTTGEMYYKYPTLSELHTKLFETVPKGTHNAIADVLICLRCYAKLTRDYDIVDDAINCYLELKNLYLENCA